MIKNKFLSKSLTTILTLSFILGAASCEKNKEEASIDSFTVTVLNDTVPAIVKVEYSVYVKNTCADYTLQYSGADSVKEMVVVENSVSTLDDIEFYEDVDQSETANDCVQGGTIEDTYVMNLLYMEAGEYTIRMSMADDSYSETITVYDPQ